MKPAAILLLAAASFFAGFAIPRDGEKTGNDPSVRQSPRPKEDRAPNQTASQRMSSFADRAAAQTPAEWPAFFRARMNDPESARLVARLWAEQDPGGFWNWLKQQHDATVLKQYGKDLLHVWAAADPDAAMRAANAITDKECSDLLRREVIDTVIAGNFEKGLELAAAAPDFNRFGWGPREWMKTDPAAVVQGLADLPERSEYRDYLNYAVVAWAENDPPALLEWLKTQSVSDRERWFGKAFQSAAATDPQAALKAASAVADPASREAAIGGVLASGKIPADQLAELLPHLSLPQRSQAAMAALDAMPLKTPEQFSDAAQLLAAAPANKKTLDSTKQIAGKFSDWNEGLAWTKSLPDPAMRRKALETLAGRVNGENLDTFTAAIATSPSLDLSNELFRTVLGKLSDDQKSAWLAKLPPDRAVWAKAVADSRKK